MAPPEVVSTRVFPVSRERLFEAFADPAQLALWWGPHDFTNEFHEFDLRPGGRWRFVMRGHDGTRYPQDKTFVEVERPARIALEHAQEGHNFRLTLTLVEEAGGTRLTWRMRFASPEELAAVEQHVTRGNEENLDRLAAHLGLAPSPDPWAGLVVERVFNAPRERVFRSWTDAEALKRWWAPIGATTPSCSIDLRVGGRLHACMRFADGTEIWSLGTFQEVSPPERLVFLDRFADAHGNPVSPAAYGMSEEHPEEAVVSVTFEALGPHRTRVTVRHDLPSGFRERAGIQQGWTEMLARLASHVEA